ncbi:hypothetical protein ACFYVL_17120 [Streptomyces sp. NPDC004111]|uniref:hypothetical protein n=1 Tax=Streptomyces sp. NPDC004111 TaxID=3364690 RepID=UPI0036CDE4CC
MTRTLDVQRVTAVDAGIGWDAVRVSTDMGRHLRRTMICRGKRTGPILVESARGLMYFFVPAGSLDGESLPGVVVLGEGSCVVAPPYEAAEGQAPYGLAWAHSPLSVGPGPGRYADAAGLVAAVELAHQWGVAPGEADAAQGSSASAGRVS